MNTKIQKLQGLIDLFKSNNITRNEFETLKKELLSDIVESKSPKVDLTNGDLIEKVEMKYSQPKQKSSFYQQNSKGTTSTRVWYIIVTAIIVFSFQHYYSTGETPIDLFNNIVSKTSNNTLSQDELTGKVRSDIDVQLSQKARENNMSFSIESFGLVRKSNNEYTGLLKTLENNREFTYEVDITVDGKNYLWHILNN